MAPVLALTISLKNTMQSYSGCHDLVKLLLNPVCMLSVLWSLIVMTYDRLSFVLHCYMFNYLYLYYNICHGKVPKVVKGC